VAGDEKSTNSLSTCKRDFLSPKIGEMDGKSML
jgi:hypothetical protein